VARNKKTEEEFSVKEVVRKDLHPTDVASLNDEISALRAIAGCEYVIRLKEVYEDAEYTRIVMERISGEPLIDRLITNKKLTEFDAKELARNLLLGVAYCHEKRIANRNLKLENLHLVSLLTRSSLSSSIELCRRETDSTFLSVNYSLPGANESSLFATLSLPKWFISPTHCTLNVAPKNTWPRRFW
jgi:serine/threonine protein kinase